MTREFEYLPTLVYQDTIEIEDIFQVCIEELRDDYNLYYLLISTNLGCSDILELGPVNESGDIIHTFNLNYSRVECKENNVIKRINSFLKPLKQKVVSARQCKYSEALDKLPQGFESIFKDEVITNE